MTADRPLRMGILGAALIAPPALVKPAARNPRVEVTAIAARDPGRAADFARKHGIPQAHAGYEALLADPAVDAVYVPLPNSLHSEWSIRALRAGKHVLCEKPLAANAAEARAMAATASATGLTLAEAFHYRYHPLAARAREIVRSGELGAIVRMEIRFCTPSIRPNNIRFRYDLAGGATMDLGCYAVDMLRFLSGEELTVDRAEARLASPQIDRYMEAHLALASGAAARIICSMRSTCLLRLRVHVEGELGTMTVTNMMLPQLIYHRLQVQSSDGKRNERFTGRPTYEFQLEAFERQVRTGHGISSTADEGVKNMQIIDAIYRAAGLKPRGT